MWGFILAVIILVIGVIVPEFWKRRKLARLKLKPREESNAIVSAIEMLRIELITTRAELAITIWQAEATFCAIMLASIVALLQAMAL